VIATMAVRAERRGGAAGLNSGRAASRHAGGRILRPLVVGVVALPSLVAISRPDQTTVVTD